MLAGLGLALAGLVWSRRPLSPSFPSSLLPSASASATAAPSTPQPAPTPFPSPAPARVVVDFQHPLASGRLRLWLDEEELLVEPVRGEVKKNPVLFKLRGSVLTEVLDVGPGRHLFRVEVSWDDERRSAEVAGRFESDQTYRLDVRLGRLQKELSLRWTR